MARGGSVMVPKVLADIVTQRGICPVGTLEGAYEGFFVKVLRFVLVSLH